MRDAREPVYRGMTSFLALVADFPGNPQAGLRNNTARAVPDFRTDLPLRGGHETASTRIAVNTRLKVLVLSILSLAIGLLAGCKGEQSASASTAPAAASAPAGKAALSVAMVHAEKADWSLDLAANGTVSA